MTLIDIYTFIGSLVLIISDIHKMDSYKLLFRMSFTHKSMAAARTLTNPQQLSSSFLMNYNGSRLAMIKSVFETFINAGRIVD